MFIHLVFKWWYNWVEYRSNDWKINCMNKCMKLQFLIDPVTVSWIKVVGMLHTPPHPTHHPPRTLSSWIIKENLSCLTTFPSLTGYEI